VAQCFSVGKRRPGSKPLAASIALCTVILTLAGCGSEVRRPPAPPPRPRPPRPLTTAEMQQVVDGAARLNRSCREKESPTALYVVRLTIEPDGSVSAVEPMAAQPREQDPATWTGVARYIEGGKDPETPVVRCFAGAFEKLRFRRFGGSTVAFDYPIVVENLPPSEPTSETRSCERDADCVRRPRAPCTCRPCGRRWRRAVNRATVEKWHKRWRRLRQRRRRWCRRRVRKCKPCEEPLRWIGDRVLCIEGQCSVR